MYSGFDLSFFNASDRRSLASLSACCLFLASSRVNEVKIRFPEKSSNSVKGVSSMKEGRREKREVDLYTCGMLIMKIETSIFENIKSI